MKTQFTHTVNNSLKLFIEHEILNKGAAYRNVSGQLYYAYDPRIPNSGTYSNPYGQCVYDSSINGANIISGVWVGNTYLNRGQSGLVIDYGGRVILPFKTDQKITANYAVKDFNTYTTYQADNKLIYNGKMRFRPQYNIAKSGLPPIAEVAPCIYIRSTNAHNVPFALGGEDESIYNYRLIAMAENEYMMDGLSSIIQDMNKKVIQILPNAPFNRYGDLSSGSYNYLNDVGANHDTNQYLYIDCSFDRFQAEIQNELDLNIFIGMSDLSLTIARFPRL